MRKVLRYIGYGLLSLLVIGILVALFFFIKWNLASKSNMKLLGEEAKTLVVSGLEFRDLNKNGSLDIYEDPRASTEAKWVRSKTH